jgi:hypothetical protein
MSDHAITSAKLDRLIKHLKELGFDSDLSNYNLLGIQWMGEDRLQFDNRLKKNVMKSVILITQLPLITSNCVCTQSDIKYNCIIRHLTEKRVLTIGICCYKAMTERNKDARKQICSTEGCDKRHRNIKYTVCNDHKKELLAALKLQRKQEEETRREDERNQIIIKRLGEKTFGYGKRFRSTSIKDIPDWYVDWLFEKDIWNNRVYDLMQYRNQTQKQ